MRVVASGRNDDVWVVVPVFNEASVVGDVIAGLRTEFSNVVGVDDGSHDGSADAILRNGAHLVRHPINLGQGAALETGMRYALARPGASIFVTFDADGQHRVEDAVAMVDVLRSGEADVVLGSRFLRRAKNVPIAKRIVLRAAAAISPTSRKLHLTDAHNGLRVFGRKAATQIRIEQNGMAHASEIVATIARLSLRVVEFPMTVLYTEYSRAKGQSLANGINIVFDQLVDRRGGR
jgi:glycosyltransferase involved in cell wall biosynthesis